MTEGKRKQVKRKTKEELENYLIQFYETEERNKIVTFKDCYNNWLEFKRQIVSDNTIYKYEYDYIRYFQDTEFENMNVILISEREIIRFLTDTAKRLHLLKKTFKSLTGYINEILDYAVCDHYIDSNPYVYVKLKLKLIIKQYVTDVYHTADERTLSNTEIHKLLGVIKQDYINKPYSITP